MLQRVRNVLQSISESIDRIERDYDITDAALRRLIELDDTAFRILPRGSGASINGKAYENMVLRTVRKLYHNDDPFCVETETAGSSGNHDILCTFNNESIPIEVKIYNAPDWKQLSITPTGETWRAKLNRDREFAKLFENLIEGEPIFDGKIPPVIKRNMTQSEWHAYKDKKKPRFDDWYKPCHPTFISEVYKAVGCYYIQISDYGLYHTGEDVCGFNVPLFSCKSQIRVRVKIHSSCIKQGPRQGYVSASVMCAAQPVDSSLRDLEKSPYSLDDVKKAPTHLSV
jgi:hypothetical protein